MRKIYLLLVVGMMLALALTPESAPVTASIPAIDRPPHDEVPPAPLYASLRAAAPGNLLVNGGMDELSFYWMPPNHHVAGGWGRWWIHGTVLPEYDDTRSARPHYDGDHAQVYFKWFGRGQEYHAGIYQMIDDVTPCVPYRFTMWARNHTLEVVKPHARIGLDPVGTQLTSSPAEGAVLALPPTTVWSAEQKNLFVWEQLSVEVEPVRNRLAAITFAHPELPATGGPFSYYADTYWDAGRVEQVSFPGGRFPEPSTAEATDFVSEMALRPRLDTLNIEWILDAPAPAQIWYRVVPKPVDDPPETIFIAHQIYLPLISQSVSIAAYTESTLLSSSAGRYHQAVISGLEDGDTVEGVVVVRRPIAGVCTTEIAAPFSVTIDLPYIEHLYLPLVQK
ncbi:MAG: hypothetical protein ACLFTI_04650 [Anaerolineales bacterium]